MSSVKMTRLFSESGYDSIEICQPNSPIHRALQDQGLRAACVHAQNYFAPSATRFIRKHIDQFRVQAVFLHSMRDIWLVTPALYFRPSVRLFAFARMFLRDVNKKDLLHRHLYKRIDKMIALSHAQKSLLLNCLPLPEDKYEVIPNGVDTQRFQPRPRREDIRTSWQVNKNEFLFGLIGRIDRQKGSLEFVEAAAQVQRNFPQARFIMVGGNTLGEGDFTTKVLKRIKELDFKVPIILTDFRTDIPDVLNALDAFVMPSYEENFANVMLEALASGLPCIGTSSGGTPEILSHGDVGLLCEPQSSSSLAESMASLIQNKPLAIDLAQKARTKALTEYDMAVVFRKIEQLIYGYRK